MDTMKALLMVCMTLISMAGKNANLCNISINPGNAQIHEEHGYCIHKYEEETFPKSFNFGDWLYLNHPPIPLMIVS